MKKIISVILAVIILTAAFTGCASPTPEQDDKLSVVCTVFPIYDWTRQIIGDKAETIQLTLLLGAGVDLHNYQPTADDIIALSSCDLFIYIGGESDAWAKDALEQAVNSDMVVINLMQVLGDAVKTEQVVEGMDADDGETCEAEYDEHIWLSLKNAQTLCAEIALKLEALDPDNAAAYAADAAAYLAELAELDAQYQAAVDSAAFDTLLFGDRFPFRYMTDDYKLNYYAAFVGCSAETEASFETIAFLAAKLDELGLTSVLTIEGTQHGIAETIIQNTAAKNQTVLTLNSMQSVTAADAAAGTTYLEIMKSNLEVLKDALN